MQKTLKLIREDLAVYSHRAGALAFFSALLFSPGFLFMFFHRIANAFYQSGLVGKVIGKIIWRLNVALSSCHLSLKCSIGGGFLLPHPTAVVIGDGANIGRNVTIYQSVTIGGSGFPHKRYPQIEDGVIIYPNSVVVGNICVGSNSIIGAHSFVKSDVPSGGIFKLVESRVK